MDNGDVQLVRVIGPVGTAVAGFDQLGAALRDLRELMGGIQASLGILANTVETLSIPAPVVNVPAIDTSGLLAAVAAFPQVPPPPPTVRLAEEDLEAFLKVLRESVMPPKITTGGARGLTAAQEVILQQIATNTATTGLTETQLRTVLPDEVGTWSYKAGASGTPTLTGRVLAISAVATAAGATVTINAGDSIPVPENGSITLTPRGQLTNPTVVFTGTSSYYVELVS